MVMSCLVVTIQAHAADKIIIPGDKDDVIWICSAPLGLKVYVAPRGTEPATLISDEYFKGLTPLTLSIDPGGYAVAVQWIQEQPEGTENPYLPDGQYVDVHRFEDGLIRERRRVYEISKEKGKPLHFMTIFRRPEDSYEELFSFMPHKENFRFDRQGLLSNLRKHMTERSLLPLVDEETTNRIIRDLKRGGVANMLIRGSADRSITIRIVGEDSYAFHFQPFIKEFAPKLTPEIPPILPAARVIQQIKIEPLVAPVPVAPPIMPGKFDLAPLTLNPDLSTSKSSMAGIPPEKGTGTSSVKEEERVWGDGSVGVFIEKVERGKTLSVETLEMMHTTKDQAVPMPSKGQEFVVLHLSFRYVRGVHVVGLGGNKQDQSSIFDSEGIPFRLSQWAAQGISFGDPQSLASDCEFIEGTKAVLIFEMPEDRMPIRSRLVYYFKRNWDEGEEMSVFMMDIPDESQ